MEPPCPRQVEYLRRRPELTAQHRIVAQEWPEFERLLEESNDGRGLPGFVTKAVRAYLNCGDLRHGFIRVRCDGCGKDQLVAFSCKRRGICPSCDGKRMTEVAAHLVDNVLPGVPYRQWVLTVPFDLRYVLAWNASLRSAVLRAFLRAVESFHVKRARADGFPGGKCGSVAVLQRFDSSLRLAPHWHVLVADGVWISQQQGDPWFLPAEPLRDGDVAAILADAVRRIWRQAERLGWTERDHDPLRERDPALASCLQASLWNRAVEGGNVDSAIQKHKGPKPDPARAKPNGRNCYALEGFSLHANTRVGPKARVQLETLCKYLLRPGIAANRIAETGDGRVEVKLKAAWKDGTRAITLKPRDFLLRICALIPLPRHPVVTYAGVFAPNAKLRGQVVIAGPEPFTSRRRYMNKVKEIQEHATSATATLADLERAAERASTRLSWKDAYLRAFGTDLLECECGGRKRVIATITDRAVVRRILQHLGLDHEVHDIESIRGPPESFEPEPDDQWPARDDAGDRDGDLGGIDVTLFDEAA